MARSETLKKTIKTYNENPSMPKTFQKTRRENTKYIFVPFLMFICFQFSSSIVA